MVRERLGHAVQGRERLIDALFEQRDYAALRRRCLAELERAVHDALCGGDATNDAA
jgi:hypothetical protein